jgi:GntR family transcriptional regulator / MocR family aminotransferase
MTEADGPWAFRLDRSAEQPLAEQLRRRIREAIVAGHLKPGARLPSWRDLAVQLGVARGTVREAYERLVDEQLVTASGAAGTFVADAVPPSSAPLVTESAPLGGPMSDLFYAFSTAPMVFQMGVPAPDAFPTKLWARLFSACAKEQAFSPTAYPDPRGEPELREQLAAYLGIARGLRCSPEQVFVTAGFRGGLQLALTALQAAGRRVWVEEPAFPLTRAGIEAAGAQLVPVDVDHEGIVVEQGIEQAPDAALAVLTPGQQAPLGVTLSAARAERLLEWAESASAYVIEDDYLGELQLDGRAAPALAARDLGGRVVHLGTFSKTLSPFLGIGFLVAPLALVTRFFAVASSLSPAPSPATQLAISKLMREGHYLRHLRKTKRLYRARRDALRQQLGGQAAGLAILLSLPPGIDDRALARAARPLGLAPAPLSPWYTRKAEAGLLLGISTASAERLEPACAALQGLIASVR